MLYAFGLDAGTIQYNSVDESAILVTVNRDLTIVVSASPTGPAIYIDVPRENIMNTHIASVWNDESQAHRYAVTIQLSQIDGDYWFHNAVGQNSSTISIAFTSQSHAEVLIELCRQSEKARLNASASVMESQPINCTELGPAAEIHETTQPLARSVANAIEAIDVSHQQDRGYDSSYDISPRPSKTQPKITDDAIPTIQLDPLHPTRSNKILPAADDGPTERPPSPKLRRSLRKNIGNVGAGVESPPSLRLERTEGISIQNITTGRSKVNREVIASSDSKPNIQKCQITKAKGGNCKGQAPGVNDQEVPGDEYDLPRSPQQRVRKSTPSVMQDQSTSQALDRGTSLKQKPKAKNVPKDPLRAKKEKTITDPTKTRAIGKQSHMAKEEAASTKTERSKVTAGSSKAPDPFEAKLSLLSPDDEAATSHAKESAELRSEQNSKTLKEYVGDRRRVTQPKTQGNIGTMQHQKKGSLNGKSDLNKGRQLQLRPQKDHGPVKQSVHREQQRDVGHAQPQQAISESNGPRLPVPAVENKRKAVSDGEITEKRPKLVSSNEQKAALYGVSSQSTRVAESGSPMPSRHALNRRVPGARYDERGARIYPPLLPRPQTPPKEQWGIAGFDQLFSNSKAKCDSPTAPSNFTAMAAHHISEDGTLVNTHTNENIVPQVPQDPFTGGRQPATSDLMLALRRESGTEARLNTDPDETLVEGQLPTNQREDDDISISSATTSTSSESASSGGDSLCMDPSSEEGNAAMMAQWRSTLQPYQRRMVSLLSDISQVSNANTLSAWKILTDYPATFGLFGQS